MTLATINLCLDFLKVMQNQARKYRDYVCDKLEGYQHSPYWKTVHWSQRQATRDRLQKSLVDLNERIPMYDSAVDDMERERERLELEENRNRRAKAISIKAERLRTNIPITEDQQIEIDNFNAAAMHSHDYSVELEEEARVTGFKPSLELEAEQPQNPDPVYVRDDCPFHYCDAPDICKPKESCRHL